MFLTEPDDTALHSLYAVPASTPDAARPFVRANFITTVDGRGSGKDGTSSSINNPADKRVFDLLRSLADTVLVGAGTVRGEGYGRLEAPPAGRLLAARPAGPGSLAGAHAVPRPGAPVPASPVPDQPSTPSPTAATWPETSSPISGLAPGGGG